MVKLNIALFCYKLTPSSIIDFPQLIIMISSIRGVICLCGNDVTGKSTLTSLISQLSPQFYIVERSALQISSSKLQSLRQQIKQIDKITYTYAFESSRQQFEPSHQVELSTGNTVPVHWIMLDLDPKLIQQRIKNRQVMGIYQSKKCVEYYSSVYLQLATFYGMTIVNVEPSPNQIAQTICQLVRSGATQQIRTLSLKGMTHETIAARSAEQQLLNFISEQQTTKIANTAMKQIKEKESTRLFYLPELQKQINNDNKINPILGKRLATRWILNHCQIDNNQKDTLTIRFKIEQQTCEISLISPLFFFWMEGQSKLIFSVHSCNPLVQDYFSTRIWILLKSTIYSHTNQHTGEIKDLAVVRAVGSNLFLQMLRRNNLHHAYLGINKDAVICSRKVETNGIEIIFKKQFVGTDKHSYFGLKDDKAVVGQNGKLACGIYVRFDWRNPNHYLVADPSFVLNQDPYYYIIEKYLGKQSFFRTFLKKDGVKPMGDKCISEDLIKGYADTDKIKQAILSLYCSFAYYCSKIGLQIVDGCCMFNRDGSMAWSQINPDCMRVKRIESDNSREDYDKDIWRSGGSDSKTRIIEKWTLFNKLLIDYFAAHRFHQTELLQTTPLSYPMNQEAYRLLSSSQQQTSSYRSIFRKLSRNTQHKKQIIVTIDISEGKPTLVRSSQLSQTHSEGNIETAYNSICLLPKLVVVDLDAAIGRNHNNRTTIGSLKHKRGSNVYGVGGGIRNMETLEFYLNQLSIERLILSSNLQLLSNLPIKVIEKRIIVELSINQQNQVLTHGRTVNTGQKVIAKMIQLSRLGVRQISITFNHREGHLKGIPRQQFRDIMFQVPGTIQKVIIAGGISSLDDLEYIWGFPKAVPQLGSAIWKEKISIVDIYNQLIQFNQDNLCPAIITDTTGALLGQVYMNHQAVTMTLQSRQLYRYSRKLNRLIKKGQQSGNTQKVIGMRLDCDQDCLNIIVEQTTKPFCHQQTRSCFGLEQNQNLQSLEYVQEEIRKSKAIQEDQEAILSKLKQQIHSLQNTKYRHVENSADMMSHLLMYLKSKNIALGDIFRDIQLRTRQAGITSTGQQKQKKIHYLGIIGLKHSHNIDKAIRNILGIQIVRPVNRSLKDQDKFTKYFGNQTVELIGVKSKDMCSLLNRGFISSCFNFSIMMENVPKTWNMHQKQQISQIKLALLKRKGQVVNPLSWTKLKKGRIASEYPRTLVQYFNKLGIEETCYQIQKITGSSESYLMSQQFDYCDGIVETGQTVEDNNLEIEAVLYKPIYGAFYTLK